MNVILIGAGRLATNLGKALVLSGNKVEQVFSRTMESASCLAKQIGAEAICDYGQIRDDADIYIISVKDSALKEVIEKATEKRSDKLFVHTAGSMPVDMLKGYAKHYGVLYPMQTFSKEKEVDFKQIPCFVEANDDDAKQVITDLSNSISDSVYYLSTDERKYLHLAAVFACNFSNHCFAIAEKILGEHGLPFSVMLPLVDETARKAHTMSPKDGQTGPAVREDRNVMAKQQALLPDDFAKIYEQLSESIIKMKNE